MTATENGAATDFELIDSPLSESEAENEFLKRFLPPDADKQPSEEAGPASKEKKAPANAGKEEDESDTSQEEADETPAEEPGETEDAEGEEGEDGKRSYADDESTYVKIKVGDEEHEVPVKDLKRLYGQEASLTKKSMEVADTRKKLDDEVAKTATASAALLERARQRFEPYSKIDFNLAATQLSPEEYTALRTEAQAAYADVQFLEKSLGGLMDQIKQKQEADLVETARESLKVLSGPVEKGGIEGWSEKHYDDLRAFAVAEGAPAEQINRLVDAWAIRLLNMAMLYKRGQSKVITKKVNKTPTKIVKTTVTPRGGTSSKQDKADAAMKKLRQTGKEDDAVDVFLSRWAVAKDEQE